MNQVPDSPFNYPRSSFNSPVPPPLSDPNSGVLVSVTFNEEWLPYVLGCLWQLWQPTTWLSNDPAVIQTTINRAIDLTYLFTIARALSVPPTTGLEDDMPFFREVQDSTGCWLEFQCCPGQWIRLAETSQIGQPPQPGGTQPQPQPGGGSQCYSIGFPANSIALVPTVVSAGDTITMQSAQGAGSSDGLSWECVDGSAFFAGVCASPGAPHSGDPAPTVNHMALIFLVNGVYYRANVGDIITVPSGVVNAQVYVLANSASLASNSGSYSVDVCVQNNQAAMWSHTFDFTHATDGWFISSGFSGHWVPGTGFVSDQSSGAGEDQVSIDFTALPSRTYTGWSAVITSSVSSVQITLETPVGTNDPFTPVVGSHTYVSTHTPVSGNVLRVQGANFPTAAVGEFIITSVTITGTGTDPF